MKIENLQLKNFKRFTDLTLQNIPDNAKLVLLIGSNGSGKSSVFDAFEFISNQNNKTWKDAAIEFRKNTNEKQIVRITTHEFGEEGIIDGALKRTGRFLWNSFYGRTSFRQIPRLTRTSLGGKQFNMEGDGDRAVSFIDRDERFENDIEHILGKLLEEFFVSDESKSKIKSDFIAPINEAFERIFNKENGTNLTLKKIIPPLEGKTAQIIFEKGTSDFHYNYLSAGEKEVFNILVNLVARMEYYTDTIYFFDEIDLHLNTRLQYSLLKEIVENWIPDNCQFWTASHSLGFIQYAKESKHAVIFDLDDLDFDYPQVLSPEPKDNPNIYEIAVNKELLPQLFRDYKIFFVENKDKNYYSALGIPNVLFVQSNDKKSVYHKTKNGEFYGIIDRDFLSDDDIEQIENQYHKLKILRLYSIENYLYHPNNLKEYFASKDLAFDDDAYKNAIGAEKEKVKGKIIREAASIRTGYSFFEEPEHNGKSNQNRFKNAGENFSQVEELEKYLNSDDFEIFYKIFPMKENATQLKERQHIPKTDLAKMKWFKTQIENIIE